MNQQVTVALSPRIRATLYMIWALGSLAFGAVQVGYSTADLGQPTWLAVCIAVWAFVGAGLGLTAASNVNVGAPEVRDPDIIPAMADDEAAKTRFQMSFLALEDEAVGVDPEQVEAAARRASEAAAKDVRG